MRLQKFILFLACLLPITLRAGLLNISQKDVGLFRSQTQIEICWLTSQPSEVDDLKNEIESFLDSEIKQKAGLNLQFLGACLDLADPFKPIGIAFFDAADNSDGLQAEITGVANKIYPGHPTTYHQGIWTFSSLTDIILTSKFEHVSPKLQMQATQYDEDGKKNLLLSIALHELMHALGFAHENIRPDSSCQVEDFAFSEKMTAIGPFDGQSIMNRCHYQNFNFQSGPVGLSAGDIDSLKIFSAREH